MEQFSQMSQPDPAHQEKRLLEERDRTVTLIQQAEDQEREGNREAAGELSRVPLHVADAGSDTQESEKDAANATRGSEQLDRIDEALDRLRNDPEAYSTCERCGGQIETERHELIPWTRLCATCAHEVGSGPGNGPAVP